MVSVEFEPDWASPPGETISDLLEERGLAPQDLAQLLQQPTGVIAGLLQGRVELDASLAGGLERIFHAPARFWLLREAQYRQDLQRLQPQWSKWAATFPLRTLREWAWIGQETSALDALLAFFGVRDPDEWQERYGNALSEAYFKSSASYDADAPTVTAWLRQGERLSERLPCKPWDKDGLEQAIPNLRRLTRRKNPQHFMGDLQATCSEFGVAVVVLRAPSGCPMSGATRFVQPDKAVLLLSARYLSDDHFWFAFFHELGHLLLHHDQLLRLEAQDMKPSDEEDEANLFASRTLIPDEHVPALLRLPNDPKEIIRFAVNLGISPGIVVGQMQHRGLIPFNHQNRLKARYEWE